MLTFVNSLGVTQPIIEHLTLKLDVFQARFFRVKTTAEALVIIQEMSEHIETSKFVLMGPSDVETLNGLLIMKKILNEGLTSALTILSSQCQTEINIMQEKHRALSTKCVGLELAKVNVNEKQELLKSSVAKLAKKMAAAKKKVPTAQKRLDAAQAHFDKVEQEVKDVEEEHVVALLVCALAKAGDLLRHEVLEDGLRDHARQQVANSRAECLA